MGTYVANQERINLNKRRIKKLLTENPGINNRSIQKQVEISHMSYYRHYSEYVSEVRNQMFK
ncbi:hypothetical protein NRK67_16860 (plasmid) [Fusobacteria bacterium ZRK30]|nr:hypothetical protein NRK67_16860 [Fusobacteria bacterium ZRK30]